MFSNPLPILESDESAGGDRFLSLDSLASALQQAATSADVSRLAVHELQAATRADGVVVGLPGPLGLHLVKAGVAWDLFPEVIPIDQERPLTRALRSGAPVWLPTIDEAALRPYAEGPGTAHMRTAAVVPLLGNGETRGVLGLGWLRHHALPADEQAYLLALGRQVALALWRAQLLDSGPGEDFLAVAAHDMRTPVTLLQLLLDGVMRDLHQHELPALARDRLRRARSASAQLTMLVSNLLDVHCLCAGKAPLELREFNLCQLADEIISAHALELEEAGCQLTLELRGPLIGRWDRRRLGQVMVNLLQNAIKYGAGRPIGVLLRRTEDGAAQIEVRDRGIGIPKEQHERIFERFHRAASAQDHIGGLGLGLWIVQQVVRAHGGRIHVESEVQAGAAFIVTLPVQKMAPLEVAAPPDKVL